MSAGSLVFVAGGTGYIGRPFISELLRRGHAVRALVRPGSENRLPAGAAPVLGDAALLRAVENPARGLRVVEVPDIRGQAGI